MSDLKTTKRKFKAHSNLLYGIITRQANSLDRAIQEGVQNSVDGNATAIHVTTSKDQIIIADNGVGLRTEDEIHNRFGTFGMPQDPTVAKTFGEHAMGRGQMMAYGVNTVRTNNFKIVVDIKDLVSHGEDDEGSVGYALEHTAENYPGYTITIDLFKPLTGEELITLNENLAESFKYLLTDVYVNGQKINSNPMDLEWNAYADLFAANLDMSYNLVVYNKGVRVNAFPRKLLGFGGVLVTHVELKLTYSRTEIMDTCVQWDRIKTSAKEKWREISNREVVEAKPKKEKKPMTEKAKKALAALSDIPRVKVCDRIPLLRDILHGRKEKTKHTFGLPLMHAWSPYCRIEWMSLRKLARASREYDNKLISVSNGYTLKHLDKLHMAYPVSASALAELGLTLSDFVTKVNNLFDTNFEAVSREEYEKATKAHRAKIAREDMTGMEKHYVSALEKALIASTTPWIGNCCPDVVLTTFADHATEVQFEVNPDDNVILLIGRDRLAYLHNFTISKGGISDIQTMTLAKDIFEAALQTEISSTWLNNVKEQSVNETDFQRAQRLMKFMIQFAGALAVYNVDATAEVQRRFAQLHDFLQEGEVAKISVVEYGEQLKETIQEAVKVYNNLKIRKKGGATIEDIFTDDEGTVKIPKTMLEHHAKETA